jgi:hypothetical protein
MKKILYIFIGILMLFGSGIFNNHANAAEDGNWFYNITKTGFNNTPLGSFLIGVDAAHTLIAGPTPAGPQMQGCSFSLTDGKRFDVSSCIAEVLNKVVLRLASTFLWIAGWFFNATLAYSLNMGNFLASVPIVDIGWKLFRDVANICFIFVLLYIAINTILQTKDANTKKLLINVIIVAVLLNFSLFMTKVVIDSSNIIALQFYEKMQGVSANPVQQTINNYTDRGISQTFIKGLGIEGIYSAGASNATSTTNQPSALTTIGNVLAVSVGGAILIITTAFVFFAGAIMFIIRTIVLIFIMILSPLAFAAYILPQTHGYWKKWLNTLLSQSFFAPLYMMCIYLVVGIISGSFPGGTDVIKEEGIRANLGSFLAGDPSAVGTLYIFVILIGLMLASLFVAKTLGAYGGDFARNAAGKATFGASSWLGRQTVGRQFNKFAKSDSMGRWRNATGEGKISDPRNWGSYIKAGTQRGFAKGIVDKGAEGTWDLRGAGLGSLAAASGIGELGKVRGEGGAKKIIDDEKKMKAEYQKIASLEKKKKDLQAALRMPDTDMHAKDGAIQKALNAFTDSEYKELPLSDLTNDDVVRNSTYAQIKAVTDEKNEKMSQGNREKIFASRNAKLKALIDPELGPMTDKRREKVKDLLDTMEDDEKAFLPEEYINNKEIFRHFSKKVQDKIAERPNLTQIQRQNHAKTRGRILLESVGKDEELVQNLMKGMSAKGLIELHNDEEKLGRAFLQKPEVAKFINNTQLKDMAELGTVKNAEAIGKVVDSLGTGAAGHQYIAKRTNRDQWGLKS